MLASERQAYDAVATKPGASNDGLSPTTSMSRATGRSDGP